MLTVKKRKLSKQLQSATDPIIIARCTEYLLGTCYHECSTTISPPFDLLPGHSYKINSNVHDSYNGKCFTHLFSRVSNSGSLLW